MAFTRIRGAGIHTTSNINTNSINATGIITAVSFVGDGSGLTGVASTDNIVTGTAATFTGGVDINSDIDVDGHTNLDNVSIAGVTTFSGGLTGTTANFSGNVTVGGVLTYEDVKNVDSLGIITARSGVDVDDFLDVGSNIKLGNAGVITATSYRGDGSQLTGVGIDTSQLDVNKLDVSGIATFKGGLNLIAPVGDYPSITAIDGNDKLVLRSNGLRINNQNGFRGLEFTGSSIHLYSGQMASHTLVLQTDAKGVKVGSGVTIETNGQATYTGIVTATAFKLASGLDVGTGAGGTWSTYTAGIATSKSVGVNTSTLDDTDLTGIGNSFKGLYISNGMIVHDNVLNGNHYIGTSMNGLMAGPVTIDGNLEIDGNYVIV